MIIILQLGFYRYYPALYLLMQLQPVPANQPQALEASWALKIECFYSEVNFRYMISTTGKHHSRRKKEKTSD